MICPNCQTENREQAKFCDQCGFPLTGAIAQVAAEIASERVAIEDVDAVLDEPIPDTGVIESFEPGDEPSSESEDVIAEEVIDDALEDVAAFVSAEITEGESIDQSEADSDIAEEPVVDPTETLDPVKEGHDFLEEIVRDLESRPDDEEESAAIDPMITAVLPRTRAIGDLSGFDETVFDEEGERLVADGYEVPASAWHDGATMQLPRIEGEEPAKSKSYRAQGPVDKTRSKTWRIVAGIIFVLAIAIAAITYSMELWGGKSVPSVVGLTQADATSVLVENGFTVRATKVKSDDTEGLVLVMDPSANSRIDPGSEVVIHVAVARYIPAVIGKSEAEARKAFEEEGFENVTYVKERSTEPAGTVLSITPAPGEGAKSASTITVKISDPFRVPDVAGKYLDEAMTAIEEAGLTSYIKNYYTEDEPEGHIVGTEPAAGTVLEPGTSVAILITRSRANELEAYTQAYLAPGNTVTLAGYNWVITQVNNISYLGNDMVSFSIVGTPTMSTDLGTAYFVSQPYSGVITWSEDNGVISIS